MKKRNLSVFFGIKLGIIIFVLISILVAISLRLVTKAVEKNYFTTTLELVNSQVQGLAYRNSKFSQQLRMYTTADIMKDNPDTEKIVEWLVAHRRIKSSDFVRIIYCDYETGIGYSDDGEVFDVSNEEYFKKMKGDNLGQYISNPVGNDVDDAVFYVCKSLSIKKSNAGCFAAEVSHDTLAKAINLITCGESGYAMLLAGNGLVMASPDETEVMKLNFLKNSNENLAEIGRKMVSGENGSEWVQGNNGRQLMVFNAVDKTPWSLAIVVPETQVYATSRELAKVMLVTSIIVTLVLFGAASFSIYRTLKPLRSLDKNLVEIATGNADLTHRVKVTTNDDIGSVSNSFNTFIEKLQSIMTEVKLSKSELSSAGNNLHLGIDENSRSISDILSNIRSVSDQIVTQTASVDETAGAVNEIASNIESLERMIDTQSQGVAEASSAVEEMIGNIGSVNQSVAKMAVSFEELETKARSGNEKQREMNERINEIESQSKMLQEANQAISNIASQTNLLAMNAAIEAAHAGEAGKGFSVVADEIRKLSETSAVQSKTIGEQLNKIKASIETVVQTSEESSRTFTSVSDSIRETDEIVRLIKSAMEEQQEGSKQIVDALHNMSDSTAEVKTASVEMSAGNKQILEQVRLLKDATTLMKDSVALMGASANKIKATGSNLDGISEKMKDSINQIGNQIDSFSV